MTRRSDPDIRSLLLQWLQPFIFLLLLLVFILTIRINPSGSFERRAYTVLIGSLAVFNGFAYVATLRRKYKASSLWTVALALLGFWGAIYIDSRLGITEFFPLTYVTITVLLASVLLPLAITVIISFVQITALSILVYTSPSLLAYNWPSFISYVLIVSVMSIIANYISSYQLKKFKETSIRDHLTGLLNRRYFDVTLEDRVKRGISKSYAYGVMLLDIDNFKKYNDSYSHATGDCILQRIATFLSDSLGMHSVVCRYGGDEFAIFIANITAPHLFEAAEGLRIGVKALDISDLCPGEKALSISIGLAMFPENGNAAELLMIHADRNLMLAKELGKDRVMPQ